MKIFHLIIPCILILSFNACTQDDVPRWKEISFPSMDSLEITADFYPADQNEGTYIILFHQANFSRGSYRTIAPKLNALGYNCVAVDQRSGHKALGVINKTCKRAIAANKPIKFVNAVQDMEAAFLYVKDELKAKKIILWGSSYSASIVIYLANKYPDNIEGVLSFSPGEYFKIKDQDIASFAEAITCPVFITSAKNEQEKWNGIYENISSEKSYFLPEQGGAHGSKALWPEKKGNEAYWKAVISFLHTVGM